jgi:protein phosphatase
MIACPQCQFLNPDRHNFCQRCGTSLVQQTCTQCNTAVAVDQVNCPNCQARIAHLWWAIISHLPTNEDPAQNQVEPALPQQHQAELSPSGQPITIPPTELAIAPESETLLAPDTSLETLIEPEEDPTEVGQDPTKSTTVPLTAEASSDEELPIDAISPSAKFDCLDSAQRYRILQPLSVTTSQVGLEIQGRVLDLQPFQLTPLDLLTQDLELQAKTIDMADPAAVKAYIQQGDIVVSEALLPYLALRLQFPRSIPPLHDGWQTSLDEALLPELPLTFQGQQQILLLGDRSELPELQQACQDETVPLEQVLGWLDEMTDLWGALEPWGCRQSLLNPANLRVEEGRFLCLRQLDRDPPNLPPAVEALGGVWQTLLAGSPQRQQQLSLLFSGLSNSQVHSITDLQSLLTEISVQLQPNPPSATSIPVEVGSVTSLTPALIDSQELTEGGDVPTTILPNRLVGLESFGLTDTGRDRPHNEDYFLIENAITQLSHPTGQQFHAKGLYILCDGMGGHAEGEVASSLAAKTLYEYFQTHWLDQLPSEATVEEAIFAANQAIYSANQEKSRSGSGRMGTTLVVVLIQDTQVRVAHVGDSRLYRITPHQALEQITIDHEVGQRDIRRGVEPEIAYARSDAYQLTQALGPRDSQGLRPEIQSFELQSDCLLLLCSDGLTDNHLLEVFSPTYVQPLLDVTFNLEEGVQKLIDLANLHNGHDNITAVAVRLQMRSQPQMEL